MNPTLAPRISIFEIGLSDENHEGSPPPAAKGLINPGENIIGRGFSTRTIDSLVTEGVMPRIDFIKMDVEGSELPALVGAEAALRQWRPKLAISLYHRPEDFFGSLVWLDSLGIGYRFYRAYIIMKNPWSRGCDDRDSSAARGSVKAPVEIHESWRGNCGW
jgi:hypothetical protein